LWEIVKDMKKKQGSRYEIQVAVNYRHEEILPSGTLRGLLAADGDGLGFSARRSEGKHLLLQ
jgi:hypothetical protein